MDWTLYWTIIGQILLALVILTIPFAISLAILSLPFVKTTTTTSILNRSTH